MSASSTVTVDVHLTDEEWAATMVEDCTEGLTATPRWLSPVWFYDQRGSELFDAITRVPEYYPTRAERALLTAHGAEIVAAAGADTLVELGSGTSDKSRCLLDAMAARDQLTRYVPFDVSEQTVRDAAAELVAEYPGLEVHAVIGDFHRHLDAIPRDGHRLVAFLGGTIGNLDPDERRRFLGDLRGGMGADDHLLLGVDLVKDPDILERAYDDAAGVTAEFNRNALHHLNERLGADFAPDAFDHVARWNDRAEWIEMHLRSTQDQVVSVPDLDLTIHLEAGEELRTEISAKFTIPRITDELRGAGFTLERTLTEPPGYALVLARPVAADPR